MMGEAFGVVVDNLMDPTHIAFLHSSLIDCSHLLRAPIQIEQLGETGLRIRRSVENGSWDGFCEVMFTGATRFDKADYHSETFFFGPGFITTSGYEFTSIDDGRQSPGAPGVIRFGHAITPATKHSGIYFSATSLNFRTDEDAFIAMNSAYTSSVVDQDIEAVNAMEPRIEKAAQLQRELLAKSDLAAARVRKLLQEMIDRENNEAPLRTERFSQ
jgi:phenylpropionate dioxygenase-like ring-hydroxylating dioxygenase large terminal subunit